MTFGVASLGTDVGRLSPLARACAPEGNDAPRLERLGATYDCGPYGELTVAEIAAIAGTSKTAIYKRLHCGAQGEALCVRRWANQSNIRKASPPRRHILVLAFKLAALFPDRVPDANAIRRLRPMSAKNATTWRQAIATARRDAGLDP